MAIDLCKGKNKTLLLITIANIKIVIIEFTIIQNVTLGGNSMLKGWDSLLGNLNLKGIRE